MTEDRARSVWGVLPVKAFARGKSRLGGVLSDPVRGAFARSLFEHVFQTLRQSTGVAGIIVVTDDDEVAATASALAAEVVRDPPNASLAVVIDAGRAHAAQLGASAALVCMADLPQMRAEEVGSVIAALATHEVVLVPDLAGAGTNVLCISPPDAFPSCFGREDSFAQHLARAEEQGCSVRVLRPQGLCFDVDGPQDLTRI